MDKEEQYNSRVSYLRIRVESKSTPGTYHTVIYSEDALKVECDCIGYKHRQACRHLVFILKLVKELEERHNV